MAAVNLGTGATITFETGFFAEITNISWDGASRPAIDVTHMGSTEQTTFGGREYIFGTLSDAGSITVDMHWNPATTPPIASAASSCALAVAGSTWTGSAAMTEISGVIPLEDKMTGSATVKFAQGVAIS